MRIDFMKFLSQAIVFSIPKCVQNSESGLFIDTLIACDSDNGRCYYNRTVSSNDPWNCVTFFRSILTTSNVKYFIQVA